MPHLKKDFSFHRLYGTKYVEQTYLAYLSRNKTKYLYTGKLSDSIPRYIIIAVDFVIRCNNAIARRGSLENNIQDIKKLYSKPFSNDVYYYYGSRTIEQHYKNVKENDLTNNIQHDIYQLLKECVEWKDKFETHYEEFKDFIFEKIKYIDDNHFDWIVGDNIIYNRAIKDRESKKYYCAVSGNKIQEFRKSYLNKIFLPTQNYDVLIEQVVSLLITISDVYNLVISDNISDGLDFLNEYLEDNKEMNNCKDIYYSKIFNDLKYIAILLSKNQKTKAIEKLKDIMLSETKKYSNDLTLYEPIMIDLSKLEFNEYIEL